MADAERHEAGEALRVAAAPRRRFRPRSTSTSTSGRRRSRRAGRPSTVRPNAPSTSWRRSRRNGPQLRQLGGWLGELQQSGDPARPVPTVSDETALVDGRNADAFLAAGELRAALREHVASTSAEALRRGSTRASRYPPGRAAAGGASRRSAAGGASRSAPRLKVTERSRSPAPSPSARGSWAWRRRWRRRTFVGLSRVAAWSSRADFHAR